MIIKSKGRKTASYGQLLRYITNEKSTVKDKNGKPFLILHNVMGRTLEEMEQEYIANESLRAYNRVGTNKLYHEILSWHHADSPNLSTKKIELMAREYFKLRNEMAMYVGVIHNDKSHIHFHACVSGTEIITGKSLRTSKANFEKMKLSLQEFEFPELINSKVDHAKRNKKQITEAEFQMQKKRKTSKKDEVKKVLTKCYENAVSKEDFYKKIVNHGLELYERGGKVTGVIDERRMRFSTLGFDESRLEQLNIYEDRLEGLKELDNVSNRNSLIEKEENKEFV